MTSRSHWIVAAYLGACLLLGGASAAGLWANALLQLLALPILYAALVSRNAAPLSRPERQLLWLVVAIVLLPIIQLVPLPPEMWTALPGRANVREGFELLGQPLPWLPISLSPHATMASLLWLLPAFAVLLWLLRRGVGQPAAIAWVMVAVVAASVLVGAMQISGGTSSPWYFYRITNYGVMVGLFANANHMATLLVVCLPFLTALYATSHRSQRKGRTRGGGNPRLVMLLSALALVAVGLVINGSLAGLGLMVPVAIASALMLLNREKLPRWVVPVLALSVIASVATVFSGWFDNNLVSSAAYGSTVSRFTSFTTTFAAAMDYLPFGSGIGTFSSIYPMYEALEQVTTTYMNHAHSDYIELLLEAGIPGLLLIVLFFLWWVRQTIIIWRSAEPNPFARAATIASAAILTHSVVDYPLRTVAISVVFAICCALMASPSVRAGRPAPEAPKRAARHLTAE